jgi:hypothetical protein
VFIAWTTPLHIIFLTLFIGRWIRDEPQNLGETYKQLPKFWYGMIIKNNTCGQYKFVFWKICRILSILLATDQCNVFHSCLQTESLEGKWRGFIDVFVCDIVKLCIYTIILLLCVHIKSLGWVFRDLGPFVQISPMYQLRRLYCYS